MTISYFDKQAREGEQTGEQTPVYSIGFELYENGISRALVLDYNDFTITGEMTSLEMKKAKPCPSSGLIVVEHQPLHHRVFAELRAQLVDRVLGFAPLAPIDAGRRNRRLSASRDC